jgi:hypothetical protein
MLTIFEKTQGDNPPHDTALSQQLSSYVEFREPMDDMELIEPFLEWDLSPASLKIDEISLAILSKDPLRHPSVGSRAAGRGRVSASCDAALEASLARLAILILCSISSRLLPPHEDATLMMDPASEPLRLPPRCGFANRLVKMRSRTTRIHLLVACLERKRRPECPIRVSPLYRVVALQRPAPLWD